MRVLIIGATGTMGVPLVNLLSEHGHDVVAVARKKSKYAMFRSIVEFCVGDAYDLKFMREVLGKYHYDAIVDFMWRSYDDFVSWFDLLSTSTDHYIVLSTSGVYAYQDDYITEDSARYIDDPTNTDNPNDYHIEKARIENYVRSSRYHNWTIVRPHMIFSESNLRLGVYYSDIWLWRTMHGLSIVIPNDMLGKATAYTYAGDVAKEFELIIINNSSLEETYTLTSDDLTTNEEVLNIYSRAVRNSGYKMNVLYINNSETLCRIIPTAAQRIKRDRLVDRRMSAEKIKSLSEGGKFEFCDWKEKIVECVSQAIDRMPEDVYKMVHLHAWMDRQTGRT